MTTTRRVTQQKAGRRIRTQDTIPAETTPHPRPSTTGSRAKNHPGLPLRAGRVSASPTAGRGNRARMARPQLLRRHRTLRRPRHLKRRLRCQAPFPLGSSLRPTCPSLRLAATPFQAPSPSSNLLLLLLPPSPLPRSLTRSSLRRRGGRETSSLLLSLILSPRLRCGRRMWLLLLLPTLLRLRRCGRRMWLRLLSPIRLLRPRCGKRMWLPLHLRIRLLRLRCGKKTTLSLLRLPTPLRLPQRGDFPLLHTGVSPHSIAL